jgi:hypothetical protein
MIGTSRSRHIGGEVDRSLAMTSPRRFVLASLATLLTGLVLANAAPTVMNSGSADESLAGIEREGDIPMPVARS